ncbi:hypothetical protein IKL45_00090 [Candidatus Saccharibacteria bacterium]|nr:hypothetical protein [Candidatus Saccharibacteria bacterium]MBR6122508.1 hypothetical protein [Candidatus Saccharibacteria bacterium]
MIERVENPGTENINIAKTFGHLLAGQFAKDPHFYLFSPDETTSNRLAEVYDAEKRAWSLPIEDFDLPEASNGRIVELLSENTLFATLLGHLSNGEQAMMTSYEAFFSIILSQILQQIKFYKQMDAVAWRKPWPAVNLLSTSMCWRQDHNGFSHQSPATISDLLDVPSGRVNCLFPVDDSAAEAAFNFMLTTENVVNLTTFDKNDTPRWIDGYHAKFLFDNGGASIFQFASDPDPEIILTAAGDIATREMLRAREIIKQDRPETRLRFIGINSLTHGAIGTTVKKFEQSQFNDYFTQHLPIVASFHGYPDTLKNILINYTNQYRLSVHGFVEEGSTTTPLEMLALNHNSRYDLAADLAEKLGRPDLAEKYLKLLDDNRAYTREHGIDQLSLD